MNDDVKALVERLNRAAISASEFSRKQAQAKSLRQEHDPPRDDLYMWAAPEQTLEGRAAAALTAQADEIQQLRGLIAGPAAWLERWGNHVGNCAGGDVCTCGLTLARYESSAALKAAQEVGR